LKLIITLLQRALEQMIFIRARSVFDDMHRSPQSKGQDCYYVPNISMPEMATTQQRYHSMYVPNNAHLQHHAYYEPPHEYQKQDSLKQYVDENPLASGVKRIFDPAEGKFVDFRFSQTSTHCSQLESSSDLSDAMRQSLASQATYLNLHNQNISSPYSEEWNVRYGGIKASSPQGHGYQHHMEHMIEHKDEVSVGDSNKFYDGYDSNQAHIHHTPLKPTTPPIIKNQLNENGNDWTSRNSLILKKMQDKINTLRSQGAEIENEMARSSAMVHHFLKELSGFNENITKEPFLPSAAAAATEDDEELSNLRSSLSSCLSINDGQMKSSMRSSLSMSEIFQSPNVQNPNAMSISSHHSQKMSLVLRQSFLSEWVDNLETEHASEVDVKALYVPDVFGSKVDKRRDVITESSQQLLEATFGSDFYGNTNTEDEHELLRNILSPKDEPLMSSIGMDMSGIWQTG
jgi:hypothetical protein